MEETIETLTAKVQELFAQAGELQYVLKVNQANLDATNQEIFKLNQKAHLLKNPPVKTEEPTVTAV